MRPVKLLGIYREPIFSPGKVRQDASILDAALMELSHLGYQTAAIQADDIDDRFAPDVVLSMAQSDRVLNHLEKWHETGIGILNSVSSVRNCYRKSLIRLLEDTDIPMPPGRIVSLDAVKRTFSSGSTGCCWVKRGDVHAIGPLDVARIATKQELIRALDYFREQKIDTVLVQEHVEGQTIKFYGIGAGNYFRAYASDSGEEITSEGSRLRIIARQAARALGLEIYGGDAILSPDGKWMLIDINDWPSFSPCCSSAARGIAGYVAGILPAF